MGPAGILAALVIFAAPAAPPPNAQALNLERADFPAGWSVSAASPEELGGCRRVPFVARAYSPRFFKATNAYTIAAGSRVTVYATKALAHEELRSTVDPAQQKCVRGALTTAALKAFGPKTRVTSFAMPAPKQAAAAIGYLVTYPYKGLIVRAYYEYVFVTHARVVTQVLALGVFRRPTAAFVERLATVLAHRAGAS